MKKLPVFFYCLILSGFSLLLAQTGFGFPDLEIIVETTECNGDSGFSSFNARKLHKIQAGWCSDPNDPSKTLQQVLLKSETQPGSYDLIWVNQAEAENIMQQIREGRTAKLERLQEPQIKVEIEQKTISGDAAAPQAESKTAPTTQLPAEKKISKQRSEEVAGPKIEILDPPLEVGTRSLTNVLTAPEIAKRKIVGKIEAPAGLLSLTVNGEAAEVDDSGIFTANIPINKSQTAVTIIAIDKQGKRQSINFNLHQQKSPANIKTDSGDFGRYHALLIANTDYQHLDNLVTPANDSKALGKILENKFGFSVTYASNTTRYDLMTALNDMRRKLTEQDNLLIYYAGHGAFDKSNNRGHWLPVDAEADSTANWVSTVAITDIVNSMSAKHVLLIADSCYSGALMRNSQTQLDPGMSEDVRLAWLKTMAEARTRHLLTSGGVKPVLDDGGNGHSIFASALIDVLQTSDGIVDGSQLYEEVKSKVEIRARTLNVEQSPQYARLQESEHEFGEFLLIANQ